MHKIRSSQYNSGNSRQLYESFKHWLTLNILNHREEGFFFFFPLKWWCLLRPTSGISHEIFTKFFSTRNTEKWQRETLQGEYGDHDAVPDDIFREKNHKWGTTTTQRGIYPSDNLLKSYERQSSDFFFSEESLRTRVQEIYCSTTASCMGGLSKGPTKNTHLLRREISLKNNLL